MIWLVLHDYSDLEKHEREFIACHSTETGALREALKLANSHNYPGEFRVEGINTEDD